MRLHNAEIEEQSFVEEVMRINQEANGTLSSQTAEMARLYARAVYRAYNEGYQDALQNANDDTEDGCTEQAVGMIGLPDIREPDYQLPEGCYSLRYTDLAAGQQFLPGDILIVEPVPVENGLVAVKFPDKEIVEVRRLTTFNENKRLFASVSSTGPVTFESDETPESERGIVLGRVCRLFRSFDIPQPKIDLKHQGRMLRTLRGDTTPQEMAQALGITESSWEAYENGEREPRDEVKASIARYFGGSVSDIFRKESGLE